MIRTQQRGHVNWQEFYSFTEPTSNCRVLADVQFFDRAFHTIKMIQGDVPVEQQRAFPRRFF